MSKTNRITLTRFLIAYILIFYFFRFALHLTPSGLENPKIFYLDLDITYWANRLLHIPTVMLDSRTGAGVFDALVFLSGLILLLFPLARRWMILFSILLILYAINFNSIAVVHTVTVSGIVVVLLPFWIRDQGKFALAWEGMRYYTCLMYFLAFLWKTVFGNAFYSWSNGTATFRNNLVEYLYYNPDTAMAAIYRWFLHHSWLVNGGALFIFLLEGTMVIGLFTKRLDRFLGWNAVLIAILNYFFADVFIFELLVLNFSFVSWKSWDRIGAGWPVITYSFPYGKTTH